MADELHVHATVDPRDLMQFTRAQTSLQLAKVQFDAARALYVEADKYMALKYALGPEDAIGDDLVIRRKAAPVKKDELTAERETK